MSQNIGLIISVLAFLVSLATVFFQLTQDRVNTRNRLTDLVIKMLEDTSDASTLQFSASQVTAQTTPGAPIAQNTAATVVRGGYLAEQIYSLATQARYLAERIPHLVTEYDAIVIARGFRNALDFDMAKRYYQMAMEKTQAPLFRIYVLRETGGFLLLIGEEDAGRQHFAEALAITLSNPVAKFQMDIQTFFLLANAEYSAFHYTAAMAAFDRGLAYCASIPNAARRSTWESYLMSNKQMLALNYQNALHMGYAPMD